MRMKAKKNLKSGKEGSKKQQDEVGEHQAQRLSMSEVMESGRCGWQLS